MGLSDRGQQGVFRYISDGTVHEEDLGKPSLAYWAPGDPDMGDGKDCVDIHLWGPGMDVYMNDAGCGWRNHPHDGGNPYFGLCEIPKYKCIP